MALVREASHVGDLVTFSAAVSYTGRSPMEIGIRVDTVEIQRGTPSSTTTISELNAQRSQVNPPGFVRDLVKTWGWDVE